MICFCTSPPLSQTADGARSDVYMLEWNGPTPARRRLSLAHADLRRDIPAKMVLMSSSGMNQAVWYCCSPTPCPTFVAPSEPIKMSGYAPETGNAVSILAAATSHQVEW